MEIGFCFHFVVPSACCVCNYYSSSLLHFEMLELKFSLFAKTYFAVAFFKMFLAYMIDVHNIVFLRLCDNDLKAIVFVHLLRNTNFTFSQFSI